MRKSPKGLSRWPAEFQDTEKQECDIRTGLCSHRISKEINGNEPGTQKNVIFTEPGKNRQNEIITTCIAGIPQKGALYEWNDFEGILKRD